MTKSLLLIFFIGTLSKTVSAITTEASYLPYSCATLLSEIFERSSTFEQSYVNLFRALVKNKNAVSASDLEIILSQTHPVNPFDFLSLRLSKEEAFAFQMSFVKLLENKKYLDWEKIKKELSTLIDEKRSSEKNRDEAKEDTKTIFAPVLLDEIKYQSSEGSIRFTFELSDGVPVAVIWDDNDIYLFDVEKKSKTLLGSRLEIGDCIYPYRMSSGETLFSTHDSKDEVTVYEIDRHHDIRIIKKDYKAIKFSEETSRSDFTTESLNHKPALLETLKAEKDGKRILVVVGYREVELETGNQRLLPVLEGEVTSVIPNGHVIGRKVDDQGHLIVRDLTAGNVMMNIPLPNGFQDIQNIHRFFFSSDGPDNIFFSDFYTLRWIDVNSAKVFSANGGVPLPNQPIFIVSQGAAHYIAHQPHSVGSVAIYDSENDKLMKYELPVQFVATKAVIVKPKNGQSVLLLGSGLRNERAESFVVFPLDGTSPIVLDLRGQRVNGFSSAYATKDGRIEGFFETGTGFKIIQLYGPLPNQESVR